jgi:hypothetical protein
MRFPNITKMCMPAQVAAGAIVLTWLMGFASLATPAGRQATALDQEFYGTTDRIVLALAAAVGGIASLGMTTIAMNALCEQGYGILASVYSRLPRPTRTCMQSGAQVLLASLCRTSREAERAGPSSSAS